MIHPSAEIHSSSVIGPNTKVWHHTQICADVRVGDHCIIGSMVYIDRGVVIGDRVKIQTGAQLYHGTIVEDGAFIGPMACLTNDKRPRSITVEGKLKTEADWQLGPVRVCEGASVGAGAIVLADVTVGRFALVGAGAVVSENVPDFGLVMGTPARMVGHVCACGHRLERNGTTDDELWQCPACRARYRETQNEGLREMEGAR